MVDYTLQNPGIVNNAGDPKALFYKVFSGEVLMAFEQACVMKDRVQARSITSGKSAAFPRLGRTTAAYHVPGTELTGTTMNQAEVVISIDNLLVAHQWLSNFQEAMSTYDLRGPYAQELGRALANQWDSHLLQLAVLAARATNVVTGLPGGTKIIPSSAGAPASADFLNNGLHLAASLFLAAAQLDNNSVPEEGRIAVVRPTQYYAMASQTALINNQYGGRGAYSDGTIFRVAGFDIVKSIHLPSTDMSTATDVTAGSTTVDGTPVYKYRGDFSKTAAVAMHSSALGTVKLMDLAMGEQWKEERQATIITSKYAVGHGVLRPEAAVEISMASS
jgi:hypothetical protein